MEYKHATSALKKLAYHIKIGGMLIVALLVCNVVLGSVLWHQANRQDIVLIPAGLMHKARITDSSVSASYLEAMALMLLHDRLSVTPKTIKATDAHLLSFVAPSFYTGFKKQLRNDEDAVIAGDVASAFYLTSMQADPRLLEVTVQGKLKRWVGERMLHDDAKQYVLQFTRSSDALLLTGFAEQKMKEGA